jgi:hypothetical protein
MRDELLAPIPARDAVSRPVAIIRDAPGRWRRAPRCGTITA